MEKEEFIPFHRPSIGDEEINEVVATLRSGWLTTGPRTAQFERAFATYVDAPHALAVNSATAGLHLALDGLGIGPGDEVITTPLTFCATVNTILHVGATPVLADIGEDGNIDPVQIEAQITSRTRAIMPVHIGGLPCRMNAIWQIAERHGCFVVEDAAHAAGARYLNRPIGAAINGAASDAVVFSFYATKNMTTGEGGMITCRSEELADMMRVLCLHGISKDAWNRYAEHGKWYYEVTALGYKYNLSDIQSAIGIHQLRKLDDFIETRRRYAQFYDHEFADMDELEIPPDSAASRHAWHLYVLRLNTNTLDIGRDEFIDALQHSGIGTSVHFIPILLHPYFASIPSLMRNPCPQALALYRRIVSLPLYPGLTDKELARVASVVKQVVRAHSKRRVIGAARA